MARDAAPCFIKPGKRDVGSGVRGPETNGLADKAKPTAYGLSTADTRRFEYPHRMMMVLCDGKHFRAGARRLKRVALSFLDAATRFGLAILVGTAESTELFLRGLHEVLLRYGLMNALYVDRGPGFISEDTKAVVARLERQLIHGQARYPQGQGRPLYSTVKRAELVATASPASSQVSSR